MSHYPEHRMYLGFRGFFMRVPSLISAKGSRKAEAGVKSNAGFLTREERLVHHFIVETMAVADTPMTMASIALGLAMPVDRVRVIVEKLERLKTFLYREDGKEIDWAYPLSLKNTGFSLTASSGERFFAA